MRKTGGAKNVPVVYLAVCRGPAAAKCLLDLRQSLVVSWRCVSRHSGTLLFPDVMHYGDVSPQKLSVKDVSRLSQNPVDPPRVYLIAVHDTTSGWWFPL